MTRYFNRTVAVTIARPVSGSYSLTEPNAIVVRDLRVGFSITKTLGETPNTCEVVLYNLSERTRAELQRKPLKVFVDVGYDGGTERLFVGDLRFCQSLRNGVEWETKLQLGDGERAFRHARVNRSFRGGVSAKTALAETAKSMGLTIPRNMNDVAALKKQFTNGLSLSGPSAAEMSRITKKAGLEWSIQDGALQVLPVSGARQDQAFVIEQAAGMIGSPEYGSPTDAGGSPILSVRSLLYPRILPGSKIQVKSQAVNGLFRAEKVTHSGDTHGSDWYTFIEAKPLQ